MECCNLRYIGKNPIDLRTDEVTTVNQEQNIVVKDVAINGNVKDLVKDRGIFNSKSLTGTDYNTITKQGVYSIPLSGSTNGPGYAAKLLVYSVFESPLVTQVAIDVGSVAIKCRYKSDIVDWTPWETVIFNTDTATTTKAGIVRLNNTVTSTSTSQAATANAVKIAYDKAVEASESTGRSETADKLTTARTIQTNLASTTSASFDGTENVTPGVTGVLPVANGGTGNSNGMMTVNLPKNQTRYHLLSAKSSIATHPVIEICEPFATAPEVGGGKNVSFGSDGATILASGESGSGLMEELKSAATEQLYLISDSGITMYVGANTYDDKKAITISNAGAITTPGIIKAAGFTGNASSASKLATARTIGITGVVTGTATAFDGSKNITIDTTTLNLEDTGVTGELPIAHGGTGRTDGKAPSLVTKRTIDGVSFDGSANITHFGECSTDATTAAKVVSVPNFVLATGAEVTVQFTVTNTAASPTLNVNNTGAKAIVYRNAAISAGYLAANHVYKFVYDGTNYELIGDLDTNTKYTAASATPKAPGTAAVGTSTKYAREDHVHPLQTTVSGNAGSATKLATARTIDGVSFDGSANITHFGTCSTEAATAAKVVSVANFVLATGSEVTVQFTVTNTAASPTLNVNGTGAKAITYRNAAISAGYLAANRVYKFVYDGTNYELIGDVNTDTNTDTKVTQTVTTTNAEYPLLVSADANKTSSSTTTARFASGATLNPSTKKITCSGISGINATTSWVNAAKVGGSLTEFDGIGSGKFQPFIRSKSTNGVFLLDGYQDYITFSYLTDENIEAGTNTVTESLQFNESGILTSSGGFKGSLTGNASSATKLATARTIDGVSFNGTANITHFGKCSTEAATAAKVVSVANFVLATGAEVTVQFTVTNTAKSPTLNVNGTGAKDIVYRNAAISAGYLAANRVYKFVYDGTNYELIGDIDTNNKYTAASETPKAPGTAAVGTSSKYAREDHIHPLQTTVSGNAGTATKLATARTISLTGVVEGSVSFDGSKNVSITTTADGIGGSIPIGGIIAFSGTFGGTNNRFPIPLGSTAPDTNWCLCDGTTTNGKTVPDLRGRMILGASSTYAAGSTGGSATHTHSISGTVGSTTLSTNQMPSHAHTVMGTYWASGGFGGGHTGIWADNVNTSAVGGSSSHTHSLSDTSTTEEALLPPYYSLSYIMRIS